MAKRLLALGMVIALVGCGTSYTGSKIGTRIVSNNSASFSADAKKLGLAYGALDAESLAKINMSAQSQSPDRPTTGQPIRPKPQEADSDLTADADPAASDYDALTGYSIDYLLALDAVAKARADLSSQVLLLRSTPKSLIDDTHEMFGAELAKLDFAAAKVKQDAWQKATPDTRYKLFKARLDAVVDYGTVPSIGNDDPAN